MQNFFNKSQFNLHFLGFFLLIGLGACTRGVSPTTYLIPKDAFFATRANILRATYQVPDWREIFKDELQVDIEADSINGPGSFLGSGKAFVFGDLLKKEKNYIAFAIAIRSRKSLERFLNRINTELEIFRYKNFKYTLRNRNILAWSSQTLLIINGRQALNDEELKKQFFRIIDQKKSEALYSQNTNFRVSLKNDYDFSVWFNIEGIKDASFLKEYVKDIDLKDNYFHVLANFDEGRISAKTEYFTSENIFKSYQNLLSGTINPEVISNAPVRNPVVMTALGINPQGLSKLLKDINWTKKAENMVNSITLTFDQFAEMIRGDLLLMLKDIKPLDSKLKVLADSLGTHEVKKEADLVIGVGIKNMVIYDSLRAMLHRSNMLETHKGYEFFFGEIYVLKQGNTLYFTKNEAVKNDFLNGVKLENQNLLKITNNSWFMLHADDKLKAGTIKDKGGKKNLLKEVARALLKKGNIKLESATIHLSNLKENEDINGESIVLLKDKTANSLMAMLEVLKEIIYQTKLRLDPNFQNDEKGN